MITIDYILIIDSVLESIKFTVNMSFLIITTMFIMNYFINSGVMKKLSNFLYPVTKKLKMNQLSLYSILSCFFSPTVGYSILAEGYTEKKITEKELIGSSLANSFPSIFSHTFTFFIPITIPLLGLTGVVYILIRSGVALIKTIIGIIYLSMVSKKVDFEPKSDNVSKISDNLKKSLKSTLKVSKRIIILMAITTFIVIFLSKNGVFDHVSVLISPFTRFFNLDPNVGILIMTCLFNVQAAMIMSSNLLKEGVLNSKEVIVGLIFANVLSLSTRYAKHSLPLHVSLFGPKLGTKIVMINAVITLLLDILIIGAIIFLI